MKDDVMPSIMSNTNKDSTSMLLIDNGQKHKSKYPTTRDHPTSTHLTPSSPSKPYDTSQRPSLNINISRSHRALPNLKQTISTPMLLLPKIYPS